MDGQAPLAAAAKLRILQARLRNNAVYKVRALIRPLLVVLLPHAAISAAPLAAKGAPLQIQIRLIP